MYTNTRYKNRKMMIDLREESGAVGSIEKSKKQCLVIDLTIFFFFPPPSLPPLWLPCLIGL